MSLSIRLIFAQAAVILSLCSISASAQFGPLQYNGVLEYSLPTVSDAPPVYPGESSEVAATYACLDKLLRSSNSETFNRFIGRLPNGDTLKGLAKMFYRLEDEDPIAFAQWNWIPAPPPSRTSVYKSSPSQVRVELQNHMGQVGPDSGATGFLLACDLILAVTATQVTEKVYGTGGGLSEMDLVRSTINDAIKGEYIPSGIDSGVDRRQSTLQAERYVTPLPSTRHRSTPGSILYFEYSPDWQVGIANDLPGTGQLFSDWIKPGEEYILFLQLAGLGMLPGDDSTKFYFTVHPLWGVFGTQGAMYRVENGKVIDPNDDFKMGGKNLSVVEWKSRLRAKINKLIKPSYLNVNTFKLSNSQ